MVFRLTRKPGDFAKILYESFMPHPSGTRITLIFGITRMSELAPKVIPSADTQVFL